MGNQPKPPQPGDDRKGNPSTHPDPRRPEAPPKPSKPPTREVAVETPWMTLREAAAYSRRNYETVRRAAVDYQRSKGRRGLKTLQTRANACHTVHRDDLVRWMSGIAPARGQNRLRAAS